METPTRASGIFKEPTSWAKVDRTVSEIRQRLERASTEIACREALISLGQTVFDVSGHKVLGEVEVSPTDAKRTLEAYLAAVLAGGKTRRHTITREPLMKYNANAPLRSGMPHFARKLLLS